MQEANDLAYAVSMMARAMDESLVEFASACGSGALFGLRLAESILLNGGYYRLNITMEIAVPF